MKIIFHPKRDNILGALGARLKADQQLISEAEAKLSALGVDDANSFYNP